MSIECRSAVICPVCGHPDWDTFEAEAGEHTCAGCGNPFWLTIETEHLFVTETIEDHLVAIGRKQPQPLELTPLEEAIARAERGFANV